MAVLQTAVQRWQSSVLTDDLLFAIETNIVLVVQLRKAGALDRLELVFTASNDVYGFVVRVARIHFIAVNGGRILVVVVA